MNERNYREVIYEEEEIFGYQREILSRRLTKLFLPVSFARSETCLRGVYHTGDYLPVQECGPVDVCEALDAAQSLLGRMIDAEGRYLFIGEYRIDPEVIYMRRIPDSRSGAEAALIWKRAEEIRPSKVVIGEGLRSLLQVMEDQCGDASGISYLRKAEELVDRGRSGPNILLTRLRGLRDEAFQCGMAVNSDPGLDIFRTGSLRGAGA